MGVLGDRLVYCLCVPLRGIFNAIVLGASAAIFRGGFRLAPGHSLPASAAGDGDPHRREPRCHCELGGGAQGLRRVGGDLGRRRHRGLLAIVVGPVSQGANLGGSAAAIPWPRRSGSWQLGNRRHGSSRRWWPRSPEQWAKTSPTTPCCRTSMSLGTTRSFSTPCGSARSE